MRLWRWLRRRRRRPCSVCERDDVRTVPLPPGDPIGHFCSLLCLQVTLEVGDG